MTTEKGKGKERDQGTEYGRWRFVLPETTMMKSHRASWRSAKEFVTVHDASYYSVFRVGVRVAVGALASSDNVDETLLCHLHDSLDAAGFANVVQLGSNEASTSHHVLDTVLTQIRGNSSSRFITDDHMATTHPSASPKAALAPARVVLLPGTRRFAVPTQSDSTHSYDCKEVLIFAHPAADLLIRRALKAVGVIMVDERKNSLFHLEPPSAESVQTYAYQLDSAPDPWLAAGGKDSALSKLEKKRRRQAHRSGDAKASSKQAMQSLDVDKVPDNALLLDDKAHMMRKQGFNIFELVGPRAALLLQAVLRVSNGDGQKADETDLRQLLSKQQGADSTMIQVQVNDPRLSYPPKLKPLSSDAGAPSKPAKDSIDASSNDLFWMGANPPRFSKGEIDSRRARNILPGARLQPESSDDTVPVVVIRDQLVQRPSMDRFTLIVPRGWGTAFFLSLVATHQSGASNGARVLGQHQLKHQRLELAALSSSAAAHKQVAKADLLSYPRNWLGTQAHAISEREAALARHEEWSKRPKGKRSEFLFVSHKEWSDFQQTRTPDRIQTKLAQDRTGVARPYPFGGSRHWEWIVGNSERLFGKGSAQQVAGTDLPTPWLVTSAEEAKSLKNWQVETALAAAHLCSAMVAIKVHAIRKGTVMPLSSLMLAPTFEDHLSWVHHLDPIDHPAAVANRTSTGASKVDKQHLKNLIERRCEIMQLGRSAPSTSQVKYKNVPADNVWSNYISTAADPEETHDRSADWNNAVGTVLDGDYSLGNGKGFGVGAITLRAWMELQDREQRLEAMKGEGKKGRRRPRNPVETTHLLLMREPGTDVVRAVSASCIPLV